MLNKINLANAVFDGISRSISVNPQYCTKIKHKSSPCTICYTVCPVQAIEVGGPGETIKVDWDKCTSCGICVSQCPTQVFRLRHGGYRRYIENISKKISKNGSLLLSCGEIGTYSDKAAVLSCVGILNVIDILVLYLNGASRITVRYGKCSECESLHGKSVLEQEINKLKVLSEVFSDLQDINILNEEGVLKLEFSKSHPVKEFKEEEKPNPSCNRRGMFSFFKSVLKDNLLKSADMLMTDAVEETTNITFTHEITARREIFLDVIMKLGNLLKREVETGALFNDILIDESCVYCGMCARFCNTGALSINDERNEITFNASKCISCGLCEKSCYHDKLHYLPTLDLKNLFTDRVVASRNKSDFPTLSDMTNLKI